MRFPFSEKIIKDLKLNPVIKKTQQSLVTILQAKLLRVLPGNYGQQIKGSLI